MSVINNKNDALIDLDSFSVYLVSALVFISAWMDTIYWAHRSMGIVEKMYRLSLYAIVLVVVAQLIAEILINKSIYLLVFLILIMFLYGVFLTWENGLLTFRTMVTGNLAWILVFCSFFIYGKRHELNDPILQQIVLIGSSVYCLAVIPNLRIRMAGLDELGGAIFSIYYSLGFLGLILLFCKRNTKVFFALVVGIMVLLSSKRAGVLLYVVGLLAFFYVNAYLEDDISVRMRKYRTIAYIVLAGTVFAISVTAIFRIGTLDRFQTITTDGGSGRDVIWESVLNKYRNAGIIKKVFGHGFHAVPIIIRPFNRYLFAHSSFVEVLFDFGIIGLVGMIGSILWLLICLIRMIKKRLLFAPIMAYSLVIVLLLSAVSYFFEESKMILPVAMTCGMCIGYLERKNVPE